jgi:hypothetical protein
VVAFCASRLDIVYFRPVAAMAADVHVRLAVDIVHVCRSTRAAGEVGLREILVRH